MDVIGQLNLLRYSIALMGICEGDDVVNIDYYCGSPYPRKAMKEMEMDLKAADITFRDLTNVTLCPEYR
jgi:hypothetical protein